MRDFVDDVQLFDGDLVDFVQDINAGDVNSVRERERERWGDKERKTDIERKKGRRRERE